MQNSVIIKNQLNIVNQQIKLLLGWCLLDQLISLTISYIVEEYFSLFCYITFSGWDTWVIIKSWKIFPLLTVLKKHSLFQIKYLTDIIAYESFQENGGKYSIIYNLFSVRYNNRIFIKSECLNSSLLSIRSIFISATWFEREIFDMLGIFFNVNSDLRRILTDYGFKYFPLRKDFPLVGYTELYYDDVNKKINFNLLNLTLQ